MLLFNMKIIQVYNSTQIKKKIRKKKQRKQYITIWNLEQ